MAKKDREAAREKAAQVRANMAKSKKRRTIVKWLIAILAVGVVVGLVVSAIVNSSRKEEQKQEEVAALELNTPSLASSIGSFAVNKDGKAIPLTETDDSLPRIEFILDPHCSGCHIVETGTNKTMRSIMENGEAQFYFTPVSFMNRASTDDYSARAASTLIEVAETDPDHFFDYIGALYENFPAEGSAYPRAGVSYEDLGRVAKSVGVSNEAIERFDEQRFRLWVLENTDVVSNRTEIFPQGISTPTVLMGGELKEEDNRFVLKDFTRVLFQDSDVAKTFQDTFDSIR